ncbi:MAG: TerB family tellurite resistance protein [Pseudomonadota bacterium]
MLDKLFSSFRKNDTEEEPQDPLPQAVAALLVEAARGDEDYTEKEKSLITHMLSAQFGLDAAEALALREKAETLQAEANDLYSFSRVVKEGLDREKKVKLIEDMWVIALSDDDKAPYEEMIIRRLIGLIHLEDTDSAGARQRAQARLAGV